MGPLDFTYVTVDQVLEIQERHPLNGARKEPRQELERMSRNSSICENCDLPVWRFGDTGMCFPCTAGESDASNDYELELI
jgi:hypothetical protein